MGTNGAKADTRGVRLIKKHLPDDILEILLEAQKVQQKKCKCTFSLESTVYLLLRKLKDAA